MHKPVSFVYFSILLIIFKYKIMSYVYLFPLHLQVLSDNKVNIGFICIVFVKQ